MPIAKQKECPSCAMQIPDDSKVCPICGYEFPENSRLFGIIVILMVILVLLYFLI